MEGRREGERERDRDREREGRRGRERWRKERRVCVCVHASTCARTLTLPVAFLAIFKATSVSLKADSLLQQFPNYIIIIRRLMSSPHSVVGYVECIYM